jgi:hypothetical protein
MSRQRGGTITPSQYLDGESLSAALQREEVNLRPAIRVWPRALRWWFASGISEPRRTIKQDLRVSVPPW